MDLSFIDASLLGAAAKASMTQNLVVVAIIWAFIKKSVKTHFKAVEDSLERIAKAMEIQSTKIESLEHDVKQLKDSVG